MSVQITKLQKELLRDIPKSKALGGYPLEGVVEHNRAYALERKGMIKVDFHGYASLTDAGRAIVLKGQQHDK